MERLTVVTPRRLAPALRCYGRGNTHDRAPPAWPKSITPCQLNDDRRQTFDVIPSHARRLTEQPPRHSGPSDTAGDARERATHKFGYLHDRQQRYRHRASLEEQLDHPLRPPHTAAIVPVHQSHEDRISCVGGTIVFSSNDPQPPVPAKHRSGRRFDQSGHQLNLSVSRPT